MIPIEARKTIGPYQVLDVIGHGGMATVYRALEPQLDRIVAIKVLLPAFSEDAAFRSRFQREARLVARLKHPNIVGIYGVGEDQGMPYLAMEYLEGTTLHTVIRKRRQAGDSFTPAEALAFLRPLAAALDYAHGEGIVHRDLKPENIILTTSGPVITDFGLAKMVADDAVTVSIIMGTPSYMAPEQIRGEMVDPRTDVYALGILLYELLTGQIPFTGPSPYAVVQAHLHLPPPALSNLNPRLASLPMLESVAQRAIAKDKPDRWPTAGALVDALERAVDASTSETVRGPGQARPVARPEGTRPGAPPIAPPARLQRPPAPDSKVGRLVLIVPLIALLLAGLWAVRAFARLEGDEPQDDRRAVAVPATTSPDIDGASPTVGATTVASVVATSGPAGTPDSAVAGPVGTPDSAVAGPAETPDSTAAEPTGTPDPAVRGVVRAPTGAFLRDGPGIGYPSVGGLPDGAPVTALYQQDGWYEVAAESGEQGWIASSLVEIQTGDAEALLSREVAPPPTPAPAPTPLQDILPTTQPQPSPVPPTAVTRAPIQPEGDVVTLEDSAFAGGFRNSGNSVYGGRTATWVYGQGSAYSSMSATFDNPGADGRPATVVITGMDSEDSRKTPMRITVNDVVIWEGDNPLPNDDQPLSTGRWGSISVAVPPGLVRAGTNTLTVTNLASGPVGRPPFVALDYATVTLQ